MASSWSTATGHRLQRHARDLERSPFGLSTATRCRALQYISTLLPARRKYLPSCTSAAVSEQVNEQLAIPHAYCYCTVERCRAVIGLSCRGGAARCTATSTRPVRRSDAVITGLSRPFTARDRLATLGSSWRLLLPAAKPARDSLCAKYPTSSQQNCNLRTLSRFSSKKSRNAQPRQRTPASSQF